MISEENIWNDFREGKSYALSYIYNKYVHILFSYGKKFTDNNELIKDTTQDLFFDLIRTRKNLGETNNIKFYLLCSLRRKLIANLKKKEMLFLKLEESESFFNIYSVEENYIENEEQLQKKEKIKKALQKLSPKQREIIYYRYTCEFDYDQICKIMSIKYDSARKQVFRALKVLKDILSE